MYWADHFDNANLRVYTWPENQDWTSIRCDLGVNCNTYGHSAFPAGIHSCPSPDGTDMCALDDWTIRGGWVAGQVIGFLWDAAQGSGGLGNFTYPYIHVVEYDIGNNFSLIDEPIIWTSSTAYAYPGSGVNGRGAVGLSLAYGGGAYFPGTAAMVRDDVSPVAWQPLNVQTGQYGPPGGRWGDFLTARAASGGGNSWLGAGFTASGTCPDNFFPCSSVVPRFFWFGRQRDYPCQTLCDRWVSQASPGMMQINTTASVQTTVTNTGNQTWPAGGTNPVHLSYHWLDSNGQVVVFEGVRSNLPSDVAVGGTVTLTGNVTAPASPGNYTLEWALVQEGVTWFDGVGAQDNDLFVAAVTGPVRTTLLPLVGRQ
jgi:hypothetical protein